MILILTSHKVQQLVIKQPEEVAHVSMLCIQVLLHTG